MSLSADQLEAFLKVAQTGSFSQAAKLLHVTQSALSQRIKALEDELTVSLLIRDPAGARPTAAGEELLRYVKVKSQLEDSVLANLRQSTSKISGHITIGAMSTAIRSLVIPAMAQLKRVNKNADLHIDLANREVADLHRGLWRGEFDITITDRSLQRSDIEEEILGEESNVLIEAAQKQNIPDIFFDHDANDTTTQQFWQQQKTQPKTITRHFLDEIYTIIDAVEAGLGRAVVPVHLISGNKKVRIVKAHTPLRIPVYAAMIKQPYFSKLQSEFLATLRTLAKELYK